MDSSFKSYLWDVVVIEEYVTKTCDTEEEDREDGAQDGLNVGPLS